jgi:hypothetical protein
MCTVATLRVHVLAPRTLCREGTGVVNRRNAAAVALVILLGLLIGFLGLVAATLYTVGVLILIVGGVGAAVLGGEYLIRYFTSRRPPA